MDDRDRKATDEAVLSWCTPLRFGMVLAVFIFAAFPRVVLGLHSFFFRDYGVLAYPFIFFQRESFWRGELPLWNPYSNCGAPYLAQWGTMVFYPFSLIYLAFPMPWSLSYFCLGHLVLGGVAMYLLVNRWVQHRFAASLAGFAYTFNGVTLSCLMWPNYVVALAWMPLVVLCAEQSWREGGRSRVWAAIVAALQLLAGVPEIVLMTWLLVGTIAVGEVFRSAELRGMIFRRLGLVVLLSAGLVAIQLLPFFDLLAHSQRDRNYAGTKWAMPEWGFANLLVPLFRCFETPQGQFFQSGQEFMSSYYLGAGVFVLAIWGCWRGRSQRVWLLVGLGVFGLLMALGNNGFLFSWFRDIIPIIGVGRYPIKFVVLTAFVVPILAAFGVRQLEEVHASLSRNLSLFLAGLLALMAMFVTLWFARINPFPFDQWGVTCRNTVWRVVFMAALLAALFFRRRIPLPYQPLWSMAALAIIGWDVFTHVPPQNPTIPVHLLQPGLWQQHTDLEPPKLGISRAMIGPWAEPRLLHSAVPKAEDNFIGKRLALWSNLNLLEGIPKVNGSSTLQLREQMQLQNLLYQHTNQLPVGLVDFLAVSHLTATGTVVEWASRTNYCPIITCGQKPVFEAAEKTLTALVQLEFDPRKVVYLPLESRTTSSPTNETQCLILSQHFAAGVVEFQVEAKEPSLVVVSQSFYHPWRASVDGQPCALWRANYAFQALQVPAGTHKVVLAYKDRNLCLGGMISGLTLLGCGALWIRAGKSASCCS